MYDRGKKVEKLKWRCYTANSLVKELTAYDTSKKNGNYYTREELARVFELGKCNGRP